MSKSLLTPAALLACSISSISLAQAAQPTRLSDQLVTASRTAQTAEQSLAAVTVFDRAQIEQSQATSVPELLKRVPGVSFANNGGPGKNTSLFMRGSESDHVLVLIDGIKVGSVTAGGAALQDLPLELIERIEVVRGPRSSLYGSEAIGGVIQIFTRKGGSGAAKPFFSAGYGTHDSYSGSAGVAGGAGAGWYSLGVSGIDTDGINVKPIGASGYEDDADGYRNLSATLSAGYRFDNGLELDANLLRAESHNDYDQVNRKRTSGFHAHADGESNVFGTRARFAPLEPWQVTLQVGRSEDKSDAFLDGRFSSRFDSRRDSASWQNDLALASGHTLTLGADHQHDEVNGSTAYAEDSRDNKGAFAQYLGEVGRHDWQLSLRRDDNQQFGRHDTGNLGYGYALSDALRATVSYGTAFKAPTFNELYYPGYGNPQLQAETSRSLEVGLAGGHGWGHWSLNAFRTVIDDLIAYDSSIRAPANVDQARIRGVELVLGSRLLGWEWNANYTLLEPENRSGGANDGNELARRAKQLFNLDLDRRLGAFSLGASLHAEGQRFDDLANNKPLSGFATLDLRGEYRIAPEWRLQARVANLLDADYETAEGFNQPGQAVYLTVRYQAL
ncbi:TonB-dependent vitamin B12 receptor [Pseudomonas sp. LPB0260]|uniref:TonB-dependent vitamin B12 receptor n=1 Tax=Pseudomonas sp. LPB0260 TaxID=2614442 RepID=UPI0015C1CB74|nr:TonB-dependent vitamin B12 receptor [Pseudomonas sp. LPB0260]QLC74397.1 TonB-dependent vitamin B12 receptor [Pseudomonas sp. LPB0260]QLC77167.1 TonB-dependent vitamin B12 receptor [Pseudomonas sp. LPB0260]